MHPTFRNFFILLFITSLGYSLCLHAQPAWQWGKRGGSFGTGSGSLSSEQVLDMATDPNGNVYVLAINNPGAMANVDGHPGIGIYDRLTLASWDCNGTFRWMKTFGAAGGMNGKSLGADTLGGIYIIGDLGSTNLLAYAYFDTDTTLGYSNKRAYCVKYDTSGTFQWLNMPQSDSVTIADGTYTGSFDMDVTPNGNIFLFTHLAPGNYNGSDYIVTEYGFHLLEYTKDGVFVSGTPVDITVSSSSYGPDLANFSHTRFSRNHNNGKFYIYGQYNPDYGDLAFGSTSISGTGGILGYPIFLAAFNPDGTNLWVKQSTPDNNILTRNCKPLLDEDGNIYIGGDAYPIGVNSFNGYTFINSMGPHSIPFVISVDSNGNNRWVSAGVNSNFTEGATIAYRNSKVWLGGLYTDKLSWGSFNLDTDAGITGGHLPFLASFNAATGVILSLDTLEASPVFNEPTALTIDKNGNAYLGGRFAEQLYVADDTLNSAGGTFDWFVAKLGSSNCNCTIPVPNYSYTPAGANTLNFSYTGSTPYTDISWDFGDGSPTATTANPTHSYSAAGNYTVCITVTNDCGSNTYCMLVNTDGTSSIGNIPGFANINIYPNPASQMIHIDHANAGTVLDVYNITGTRLMQTTLQGNKDRIDVSNLASGIYLLRFTGKEGKQGSTRFVKQ